MKFKVIMVLCIVFNIWGVVVFQASTLNDSCVNNEIINSTPDVIAGNGGQNYVSDVSFGLYSSATKYPHSYNADIAIYDWNGKHIMDLEPDNDSPSPEPQIATGIVDGTYTYVLNGVNKGSFNVNHNIKNVVTIDMAEFTKCDDNYSFEDNNNYSSNSEEFSLLQRITNAIEEIATNLSILVSNLLS